jgi:hypothetical protein
MADSAPKGDIHKDIATAPEAAKAVPEQPKPTVSVEHTKPAENQAAETLAPANGVVTHDQPKEAVPEPSKAEEKKVESAPVVADPPASVATAEPVSHDTIESAPDPDEDDLDDLDGKSNLPRCEKAKSLLLSPISKRKKGTKKANITFFHRRPRRIRRHKARLRTPRSTILNLHLRPRKALALPPIRLNLIPRRCHPRLARYRTPSRFSRNQCRGPLWFECGNSGGRWAG